MQLNTLANLTLAKYRITCRARERIVLPQYKGSALHGGFGFSLKDISTFYYKRLCEPGSGPKPYVLLPPLDSDDHYPPGREFSFEITLFGSAADYFPVCRDALEHLGSQRGFGKNRGKFEIIGIDSAVPPSPDGLTPSNHSIRGDAIASCRKLKNHSQLKFHFLTPLRLKADDRLLRQTPSFSIFFARLLGRLNSLAIFHGDGAITTPEQKKNLFAQASRINLENDSAQWDDLSRFSSRQRRWMKFGGLVGSITYEGDLEPFFPWLALGEWTHVGGKTSFGLGKYLMEEKVSD